MDKDARAQQCYRLNQIDSVVLRQAGFGQTRPPENVLNMRSVKIDKGSVIPRTKQAGVEQFGAAALASPRNLHGRLHNVYRTKLSPPLARVSPEPSGNGLDRRL